MEASKKYIYLYWIRHVCLYNVCICIKYLYLPIPTYQFHKKQGLEIRGDF